MIIDAVSSPQQATEAVARTALGLIAAATRDDEAGLNLLLSDLDPAEVVPLARFLANFAAAFVSQEAERSGADADQLADVFSRLLLNSLMGEAIR